MLKIAEFKGIESVFLLQGLANIMHLAKQHPDHLNKFDDVGKLLDDQDAPQVISDALNYYAFSLDIYAVAMGFVVDKNGMKLSTHALDEMAGSDICDVAKAVYIAVYFTPAMPMRLTSSLMQAYKDIDPETASMGALLIQSQLRQVPKKTE